MIGRILEEKYEILELLGQGGMAKVYKARDIRLNRLVAIKVLKQEFMDNEQFLRKFLREAQADAKLTHPNIVNVYDVGTEDGLYYLVMEYVDGKTLKTYIKSKKKLSGAETAEIALPVANALSHAHSNNIIHRDIKPHNILLTSSKIPKVADFGIARAITSSTVTATEEALGSVHYISPEQARGGFLDERSDLYSLGILMYEMLCGELPYDADTPVAVALKHVQNKVPSPSSVDPSIPENINQIVLNLTRRKADDRYQNAAALIVDLKAVIENPYAQIQPTYSSDSVEEVKKADVKNLFQNKKYISLSKKKKSYPIIAVAAVLLIALVFAIAHYNQIVHIPDLKGKTLSDATKILDDIDIKYIIDRQNSNDVEINHIISQNPEAETEAKRGDTISIIVSDGPATREIPDVIGDAEAEATSVLYNIGFTNITISREWNEEVQKGYVYDQFPKYEEGVKYFEVTKIILYVSKGKNTVAAPTLIGLPEADARSEIIKNELVIGSVKYEGSSKTKGTVIKQTPPAFKEVEKGSKVDIVVSKGSEMTVPVSINLGNYTSGIPEETVRVKIVSYATSKGSTVIDETYNKDQVITVPFKGYSGDVYEYKLFIDDIERYSGWVNFQ